MLDDMKCTILLGENVCFSLSSFSNADLLPVKYTIQCTERKLEQFDGWVPLLLYNYYDAKEINS